MVKKLCHIQCTIEEIASFLGMDKKTLQARCQDDHGQTVAEWAEPFYAGGKASLRRKQWATAMKGDKGMQIFLGKNMLGQSDRQDHALTGDIHVTIAKEDADL